MVSVEIKSLTKHYGSLVALDSISIDIEGPMVLGILGPNGAGKTTMLKLITGILRPTSGEVLVNGRSVRDEPKKVLMDVGSLIEQPEFYPYLTGYESLRFVCRIRGMAADKCDDEIARVSKLTSTTKYLHRRTGNYSRGMKQRLGIAAALICDPKILVLDEPTTGLDPKGMKEIREIIRKISFDGEHIVMLSTHLLNEAREVCDRVTIINNGKLSYDSSDLKDSKTITVKLTGDFRSLGMNDPSISEYRSEGDRLIIRKMDGYQNHDVIRYLIESGFQVQEVYAYDNLENRYVSIVESGSD